MSSKSPYQSKIWLKNYDKNVPPKLPEPKTPLHKILDDTAKEFPDKAALIFYKKKINFREFKEYLTGLLQRSYQLE